MTKLKLKLWATASAAIVAGGLAACSPAGEGGGEAAGGATSAAPAESGEAGESAAGEAGGEHGEAGVAEAYGGLEGPARTALRIQHLKGFVLIAQRVAEGGKAPEAGALVGQGVLEVYDPARDQFGGFDAAPLRAAEAAGGDGRPAAEVARALAQGAAALDAARPAGVNQADIAARMVDLSAGLYSHVIQTDFVDPIEYQHSLGAALSAKDALTHGRTALRQRNARAYDEAVREIDRFIALWPATDAPETATPYRDVLAQSSRVRLALAPLL